MTPLLTKDLTRTQRDLSSLAKEPVTVEAIGSAIYAFGSELATLRLFAQYQSSGSIYNDKARCGYSDNLKTFYFVLNT
jgi:hypothetical protein